MSMLPLDTHRRLEAPLPTPRIGRTALQNQVSTAIGATLPPSAPYEWPRWRGTFVMAGAVLRELERLGFEIPQK